MTIDRAADSAAAERMRRAAIEAFAESGYGGSSTRQIAKRLNMSATAMYPHYRSKEELLYAIALEGHSSLLAALKKADDPAAGFPQRLRAVVLGVPGRERRHHRPKSLGAARRGVVGLLQRGQQAAVAFHGDGIKQLLFGAVMRVHGRRAHVEPFGDLPRGAAAVSRLREGLDRGPPHAFRRS